MKPFKIDMHVHTSNVSRCGKVPASELVDLYHNAGYNAIIITDHFYEGFFEDLSGTWAEKVDHFLAGYREALKAGEIIGLSVILGMEIRFSDSFNDYLVYGFDEDYLKKHPLLYDYNIQRFKELIRNQEMLIYQAHPFRPGIEPADPQYLDGVEVYNGNPRHDSRNHLAFEFARQNSLKMISGSDFHQYADLAQGGILLPKPVHNAKELVAVLKTNRGIELLGSMK